MQGCFGWLFFGIFIVLYKIIAMIVKGVWTLILWLLQTISGRPLYYCKPEYLIPAKILGTLGLLALVCTPFVGISVANSRNNVISGLTLLIILVVGVALLWCSRFLIRRGAI